MKYKVCILLFFILFFILNYYPEILKNKSYNYSFYKIKNIYRYKKYALQHPDLTNKNIVLRVNLNLDKEPYKNANKSREKGIYTLVNKYNYLEKNYVPKSLTKIKNCVLNNQYLIDEAANNFTELCNDIKNNNLTIRVISSYRSYDYQNNLYKKYYNQDGELADSYSARPGFSEHQTGLVIDVDNGFYDFNKFENTESFKWMIENSYKYGFILRYPYGKENITLYSYEPWHYRYVGKKAAEYIYNHDITFEEYYAEFIEK